MERHTPSPSNLELEQLATDYRNNGQVERAVAIYQNLRKRFEDKGELLRAAEMQHMVGVSYKVGNHTQESLDALHDTLQRYEELKDTVHIGRAERDIGITHQYVKDFEAARPFLEASVATLERSDDEAELGISKVKLGHLFHEMGQLVDAQRWMEAGIATLEETDHWFYKATALLHLADLRLTQESYQKSFEIAEAAEHILNDHDAEHTQRRRLAQLYYLKAALFEAMDNTSRADEARQKAEIYADTLDEASRMYLHSKL